jgi:hypothetical protein
MKWQPLRRWFTSISPARRNSARRRSFGPQLELLEDRFAPATLVNPSTLTFKEADGDTVTVKLSQGLLTSANANTVFAFDTGPGGVNGSNATAQQLQEINLAALTPAAGTHLGLTVTVAKAATGNGLTNIGFIDASGENLGMVTIAGDLGRINAGSIQSLTVQSLGDQFTLNSQGGTGSLKSTITGNLGALSVKGDVDGEQIVVLGTLGAVTIGGSLNGDATDFSGNIFSLGGTGMVNIAGSIVGADGKASAEIATDGTIAGVMIGQSIIGGGGTASGEVFSVGNMGAVTVKGSVTGGAGSFSGSVTVSTDVVSGLNNPNATLAGVTIGGSLNGGGGKQSGQIFANGDFTGGVTIHGSIQGGAGDFSGEVITNSSASTLARGVTVGQSLNGSTGDFSGEIFSSGQILGPVLIKGTIQGGGGTAAGEIGARGVLKNVTVNGSILSGSGTSSGAIQAGLAIGTITVNGDLTGTASNPVLISAVGPARPAGLSDIAIQSLTVKGNVAFTNILAGYNLAGAGVNADAQIGTVAVGKNWTASSLIAGVAAGADGLFGTSDDVKLSGAGVEDVGAIVSTIGSLTITGTVAGAQGSHFGIEAEYIIAAKIGGAAKPLDPAANDLIALASTSTLQEVP